VLAEVAAIGAVPFVVLLDQDMPGEAQQRGGVGEGADHVGAALEALMSRVGAYCVADHGAMDRVRQVSFEDAHGFSAGMPAGDRGLVELAGAWFAAELGHRGSVDCGVQSPVPAAAEPVSSWPAAAFSGARWDRCGSVESRKAGFGEPARVSDLEEDLRSATSSNPGDRRQGGSA
jgi:hypothetical protein